jgi:molecular chaperone DnaJ
MEKDYYKILGVDKESSADEIKKAYRKLSKEHHPDVTGRDDSKFKDISEAYSILSDKIKKSQYDHKGSGSFEFEDLFGGMGGFNFDDIFGRSGNHGRRTNVNRVGSDIKATIDLTLDEVEKGSSRKIKYTRKENCTGCDGVGGVDVRPCVGCNGRGSVTNTMRTPMGIVQQQTMCSDCAGDGKIIHNKCKICNGSKYKEVSEELTIDIPIGVSDDVLYKYSGKGHSNEFGTGDLLVHFNIKPHRYFGRQGTNLLYNIQLPYNILITGGLVEIKGLNNKILEIDIPKMTKPGYMLKIMGEGLPSIDNMNDKGDIIFNVTIEFPSDINEEELEIISKLTNKPNFIYKQK